MFFNSSICQGKRDCYHCWAYEVCIDSEVMLISDDIENYWEDDDNE